MDVDQFALAVMTEDHREGVAVALYQAKGQGRDRVVRSNRRAVPPAAATSIACVRSRPRAMSRKNGGLLKDFGRTKFNPIAIHHGRNCAID